MQKTTCMRKLWTRHYWRGSERIDESFLNGKVVTIIPNERIAEAFAMKSGEFLAVGSNAEIRKLASRASWPISSS